MPLRGWVELPGSVTRALAMAYRQPPEVRPVASGKASPSANEQHQLGLRPGQPVLARDTELRVQGQVLVRARSATPLDPHSRLNRMLGQLGRSSLGDRLFLARGKETPRRLWLQFASRASEDGYWGRQALWLVYGRSLLVQEYFAPVLADDAPPPSRYTARRLRRATLNPSWTPH